MMDKSIPDISKLQQDHAAQMGRRSESRDSLSSKVRHNTTLYHNGDTTLP